MKKNLTDIYLEAAYRIFEGKDEFSCVAISATHKDSNLDAYILYNNTMGNFNMGKPICYFGREMLGYISISSVERAVNNDLTKARNFRVWLLCMMAACWKDMVE